MDIKNIKINSKFESINNQNFENIKEAIFFIEKGDLPKETKPKINNIQALIEGIDFNPDETRNELINIIDYKNLSISNYINLFVNALEIFNNIDTDKLTMFDHKIYQQISEEFPDLINTDTTDFINKLEISYMYHGQKNKIEFDNLNTSAYAKIIQSIEKDYDLVSNKVPKNLSNFNKIFKDFLFEKYRRDFLLNESLVYLIENEKRHSGSKYIYEIMKNGEAALKEHYKMTDNFIYIMKNEQPHYKNFIKTINNKFDLIDDMDLPLIFPKNEKGIELINRLEKQLNHIWNKNMNQQTI